VESSPPSRNSLSYVCSPPFPDVRCFVALLMWHDNCIPKSPGWGYGNMSLFSSVCSSPPQHLSIALPSNLGRELTPSQNSREHLRPLFLSTPPRSFSPLLCRFFSFYVLITWAYFHPFCCFSSFSRLILLVPPFRLYYISCC